VGSKAFLSVMTEIVAAVAVRTERRVAPMPRQRSDWVDRRALDRRGEVLGLVVDAYTDPVTHRIRWLAVATGFFGTRVAVVPVRGASLLGDDVVIAHSRHVITTAPAVDIVVGVDPADERSLIDHYTSPNQADPAGTTERAPLT